MTMIIDDLQKNYTLICLFMPSPRVISNARERNLIKSHTVTHNSNVQCHFPFFLIFEKVNSSTIIAIISTTAVISYSKTQYSLRFFVASLMTSLLCSSANNHRLTFYSMPLLTDFCGMRLIMSYNRLNWTTEN